MSLNICSRICTRKVFRHFIGAVVVSHLSSDKSMATSATTPMEYLSAITLQTVEDEKEIKAPELWKKNGAVIMVVRRPGWRLCREEAAELSSIKPQLDEKKVALYAVVHEKLGVPEFKDFFKGEVLFDPKRGFYGPEERWAGLTTVFRPSVWSGYIGSARKGVPGNLKGEGRLLGGLFVIGPGDQGVVFEHREHHIGDRATKNQVLEAVEKIKQS